MRKLILLSLGLWATQAHPAVESVNAACGILMGDLDPNTRTADLSKAENQARFEAAVFLKEYGTGVKLPEGGRRLAIPAEHREGLIKAFVADYTGAAVPGTKGASFAAAGNVGHQNDHFEYSDRLGKKLERATGVDNDSVRLAQAAHDIGKGILDEGIAAYVKEKGNSPEAASLLGGLEPFLHNYILSHEEHSIVRIPGVVERYLQSVNVDTKTEAGKALVRDYSLQIIEAIRQHNGVDVTGDLKAKYPSLTDSELAVVRSSWWASNYDGYAETMGLPKRQYGGEVTPVAEVLNFYDRATLTADGAIEKLGAQNLSRMRLSAPWIYDSMVKSAMTNLPLLKAQGDKVRRLVSKNADSKREFEEVYNEVLLSNQRLEVLGNTLLDMNDRTNLARLGVPPEELPSNDGGKALPGEKTFLYVRTTQPGDEPGRESIQAKFSKDLVGWSRVDATDPAKPKTQTWVAGKGWVDQPQYSEGNAAIQVGGLARRAKLWGK